MIYIVASQYYKPHVGGIENVMFNIASILAAQKKVIVIASNLDLQGNALLPLYESIDDIDVFRYQAIKPKSLTYYKDHQKNLNSIIRLLKKISNEEEVVFISRDSDISYAAEHSKINIIRHYLLPGCTRIERDLFDLMNPRSLSEKFINPFRLIFFNFIRRPYIKKINKELSKTSIHILLSSNKFLQQYLNIFPYWCKSKIKVNSFGVDLFKFTPVACVKKNSFCTFVFLGRLAPEKGLRIAIESFAKLKRDDYRVIIIGDGPEYISLINKVGTYNLKEKFNFIGSVTNPNSYLQKCDVHLFPSIYETFGNSILEAMSSGIPTLCFKDIKGLTNVANEEIITEGINGWLVDRSTVALSNKIQEIIDDWNNNGLSFMKKKSRLIACEKYSWNKYVDNFI